MIIGAAATCADPATDQPHQPTPVVALPLCLHFSPSPTMALTPSPVLQIEQLCFEYPAHKGQTAVPVLQGFSASLPPGVTWVGGDESRGKTTLLRLLAGELRPQSGTLALNTGPTSLNPTNAAWAAEVAWCDLRGPAHDPLYPADCFARLQQQHPRFDSALLARMIEGLDLAPHRDKALYMLSTGTRRKVALAGVLASGARLMLLDDPFAALDKGSIDFLLEHLRQQAQAPADRAWILAAYVPPRGVPLAAQIDLDALKSS